MKKLKLVVNKEVSLQIEIKDAEYFLYTFDITKDFVADTWHVSLEQAKKQVELQFPEIENKSWIILS